VLPALQLADFGMSTTCDDSGTSMAVFKTALGTPAYTDPSVYAALHAEKQAAHVHAHSDIYSWGMSLLQLLAATSMPFLPQGLMEYMMAKQVGVAQAVEELMVADPLAMQRTLDAFFYTKRPDIMVRRTWMGGHAFPFPLKG
jgi:serine/threonine protein kinase